MVRSVQLVALLLIAQVVVLWLSLHFKTFSLFCTGASRFVPTADVGSSYAFGTLHLVLGGLFFLGMASLGMTRLRPIYVIAVIIGMGPLPIQVALVDARILTCDGP